jgi:hypothetical protein
MRVTIGIIVTLALAACSAGSGGTSTGSDTGATGSDTGGSGSGGDSTTGGTTTGVPVTGTPIGQICDQNHACHDQQACVGSKDSKVTYCTIACGTSNLGAKKPPTGGPELCAECPTISGVASCDTTVPNKDGKTETWLCGITCGDDAGACPTGLTCTAGDCN